MTTGTLYTLHFSLHIDNVQLHIDLACPQVHRNRTLYTDHEQLYIELA